MRIGFSKRRFLEAAARFALIATLSTGALTDAVSVPLLETAGLLALMRDRSPGERTAGTLTDTKRALPDFPAEPETSAFREWGVPPPGAGSHFGGSSGGTGDTPEHPVDATPDVERPDLGVGFSPPPDGLPGVGRDGFIVPPFSGGGGGGGVISPGVGGGVIVPPPPVAAVPEPATWMTMFVGFGAIGGLLRWRRRMSLRRSRNARAAAIAPTDEDRRYLQGSAPYLRAYSRWLHTPAGLPA